MSIEQTSQLISLMLNSVLMTLLSAVLLGGVWLRQDGLYRQLQQVQKRYQRLTRQPGGLAVNTGQSQLSVQLKVSLKKASLKKIRDRRQKLIGQYRWSYASLMILHSALLTFGVSLLALALRSLFLINGLISVALVLFALGVAGLLIGTSCLLVDLAQGNSGNDSLSYSLAKILRALAQQIRQRQRNSRQLAGHSSTLSLKPLSVATRSPHKKLPNPIQEPYSLIR